MPGILDLRRTGGDRCASLQASEVTELVVRWVLPTFQIFPPRLRVMHENDYLKMWESSCYPSISLCLLQALCKGTC